MKSDLLVAQGNEFRSRDQYQEALRCYAEAYAEDPNNKHAWNNYGNVLREIGEPKRAIPFLQHACELDPTFVTAQFNIAIAALLDNNYELGWQQYEWRWQYEHLAGTLPTLTAPRWTGQDIQGKTILIIGEQGFGDIIQFSRFILDVCDLGANIIFQCLPGLVPLFQHGDAMKKVISQIEDAGDYDYWIPLMSVPGVLKVNIQNLQHFQYYLKAESDNILEWQQRLGPKQKTRVGIAWSGRTDNWVNQYKQIPVKVVADLISRHPEIEWISLQVEASDEVTKSLNAVGLKTYPGTIKDWGDTAGLVHHLDLIISADTSIAHLAGAMGRETWIPLTKFAVDWRWGVTENTTPWYPTAKLIRQPDFGDWKSVINRISKFLQIFKI